jgi:hypothetical protein
MKAEEALATDRRRRSRPRQDEKAAPIEKEAEADLMKAEKALATEEQDAPIMISGSRRQTKKRKTTKKREQPTKIYPGVFKHHPRAR